MLTSSAVNPGTHGVATPHRNARNGVECSAGVRFGCGMCHEVMGVPVRDPIQWLEVWDIPLGDLRDDFFPHWAKVNFTSSSPPADHQHTQ